MKVMIQVEAGSRKKLRFDEKSLAPTGAGTVARPYPYPYGFVLETTAPDGDNADCYIIRGGGLESGTVVECEPVGLLEQDETGQADHKVLAVVSGDDEGIPAAALEIPQEFIYAVFVDFPEVTVRVGPLLPREAALRYLDECRDD